MSTVATLIRKKVAKPAASAKRHAADEAAQSQLKHASTAFAAIFEALDEAAQTDKPDDCGDCGRLLRMAADLADGMFVHTPPPEAIGNEAFQIAALLKAAARVPGYPMSEACVNLVQIAGQHLALLTGDTQILQIAPPWPTVATPNAAQFTLPSEQHASFSLRLEHASAMMKMLVHVFGGDAGLDDPSKVEGLMGTLQQADNLLSELNLEIMAINGDLPGDLRWRTVEAAHMIQLVERLQSAGDYDWRLSDAIYCSYFDAASNCIDKAKAALQSVKTKWSEAA